MDTQPANYVGAFDGVPNPTQAITQGFQAGVGMQQLQLQQQMQQYQMARMRQMQAASMQVAQNPTPDNIAQLSVAFPEMSEQFKRSYDMLQPQQQRANVQHMSEVYAAAQSGRPDIAAQLLTDRADALKNSGQDDSAARTMAKWATTDPQSFQAHIGTMLAGVMGPDKFGDTFNNLATGNRTQALTGPEVAQKTAEVGKTQAETSDLLSQVNTRAGQLQLDRDKLMTETQTKLQELQLQYGKPLDSVVPVINDAMTTAAAGEQAASRYSDLADRIEKAGFGHGWGGKVNDALSQVFGVENGTQALKQEYTRIVNNQALGQIKDALGGRVTDVDMKVAMGPVPDANADKSVVTAYLRGNAKLMQLAAAQSQAKGEWLAQVGQSGSLGRTPRDINIMGTQVPAGSNFADFSRQFIQQKAEQIAAQTSLAKSQGRSYMRFAAPGAASAQSPNGSGIPGTVDPNGVPSILQGRFGPQ